MKAHLKNSTRACLEAACQLAALNGCLVAMIATRGTAGQALAEHLRRHPHYGGGEISEGNAGFAVVIILRQDAMELASVCRNAHGLSPLEPCVIDTLFAFASQWHAVPVMWVECLPTPDDVQMYPYLGWSVYRFDAGGLN